MKKMKIGLVVLCFLIVIGVVTANEIYVQGKNPLEGKVIALDAGHVGYFTGAIGDCGGIKVYESAVNLTVRAELKDLLEAENETITVFEVPQLSTRRERVAAAEEAGADILISIHHNGSLDMKMDYTETFITQTKFDKPLAEAIHPKLVGALKLPDHGITNSGFGITVFGDHPAVLTEAYFITNTEAACDFIGDKVRVKAEVQGLYDGIIGYFTSLGEIDGPLQKNR